MRIGDEVVLTHDVMWQGGKTFYVGTRHPASTKIRHIYKDLGTRGRVQVTSGDIWDVVLDGGKLKTVA